MQTLDEREKLLEERGGYEDEWQDQQVTLWRFLFQWTPDKTTSCQLYDVHGFDLNETYDLY